MVKPSIVALFVAVFTLLCLPACDVDLFGLREKEIAAGYRLYMGEHGGFAIISPGAPGGPCVKSLGWRRPFIVAVTCDGDWQVFDSSTGGADLFLTAQQVSADPRLRDIPLLSADVAWKQLSRNRSQW
jgi:hypothetical protein